MEAAITVAVGLGGALLGVIGGFWGALHLERRREIQRRQGMIAGLYTSLSDNAVKGRGLLQHLEEREVGPLWDAAGPVSADFWQVSMVDAGSFLPFDLFFKMRIAYEELPFIRTFGDHPERAPDKEAAVRLVQEWISLVEDVQGEILELPEAQAIKSKLGEAGRFISDRAKWKKDFWRARTEPREKVKNK